MIVCFCKTDEMDSRSYVKFLLRSNAILNNEKNGNYYFLWSILLYLHPCNNNHPNKVSKYIQYFNELNIQGFDFTKRFKCSDVQKIYPLTIFN